MKRGYSALDIATWFIYKTNAEMKENQSANDEFEVYEGLTHLKLQKLLYFAQGLSLAINDDIIFSDKIEAWEHGPVIKSVYNEFSKKGRKEITLDDAPSNIDIINKIESDSNVKTILNLTYDNFAIYTAWQLRNLTHQKGSPWYQVYFPGKNKEIYPNLIKDYFKTNVVE